MEQRETLQESFRHFQNHLHQMHDYRRYQDTGWPICLDAAEAARK